MTAFFKIGHIFLEAVLKFVTENRKECEWTWILQVWEVAQNTYFFPHLMR